MCRCLKLHHHHNAGLWLAKVFGSRKVCSRELWHMEDIHLKSLNKKKITPLRQQAKLMFLTPDLFPFHRRFFFFFRFCCPDLKRSMTADSLMIPTKLLLVSSSSFLHAELHSTSCGNPGVPPKAVLSGSGRFAVGDQVQYSCVPGYVLDGHATLTCITNAGNTAVWDFPAPICRGMRSMTRACVWLYRIWSVYLKRGNSLIGDNS